MYISFRVSMTIDKKDAKQIVKIVKIKEKEDKIKILRLRSRLKKIFKKMGRRNAQFAFTKQRLSS